MLNRLRQLFRDDSNADGGARSTGEVQLATAALLVEMIRADGIIEDSEITTVRRILRERFSLAPGDLDALMHEADRAVDDAVEFHAFAAAINKHFDAASKTQMIECMWRVAYADGEKDMLEEHLIRRIAEILYVPHHAFIQARRQVESELDKESSKR